MEVNPAMKKKKTSSAFSKITLIENDSVLNNEQELSAGSQAPYLIWIFHNKHYSNWVNTKIPFKELTKGTELVPV